MAQWYAPALAAALNAEIDYVADTVVATLHTSTYTPDRVTHDYVSDLTGELATAGGYTQGGVALTTKSVAVTAANSWATTWAASTAVEADHVVRPTTGNGFLYRCVVAGTTGGSAPTWPTVVGQDVADGATVVWECVGRAILVLDCDTISWATATFTGARFLVISDRTEVLPADQPLIGLIDFVTDQDGGGGSFDVVPDPQGLLHHFIA